MNKEHLRAAIWVVLLLPTILFVIGTIAAAAYMFWPRDIRAASEFIIPDDAKHLSLISHGLRDQTQGWPQDTAQSINLKKPTAIAIDWRELAQDPFTCSVNGRRIGSAIGRKLASKQELKSLHLIAHSCGSFISYGICEALKEQRPAVIIHSTYLDPVSVYGGFFWDFGIDHFGDCADYADAYIDTADTVPGSNVPLPNAHTYDISAARLKNTPDIHPHIWPRVYYQRLLNRNPLPSIEKLRENRPIGETTLIFTDEPSD